MQPRKDQSPAAVAADFALEVVLDVWALLTRDRERERMEELSARHLVPNENENPNG